MRLPNWVLNNQMILPMVSTQAQEERSSSSRALELLCMVNDAFSDRFFTLVLGQADVLQSCITFSIMKSYDVKKELN